MITVLKRKLISHTANIIGWKTKRKIVTFLSDDWGSIRTASKGARENLVKAGLNFDINRFDKYDALEDANDLAELFTVLNRVNDKNGNPAVFTPFAVVTNPDFEKIQNNKFEEYEYEILPETFNKRDGYEKTWSLWKEGIEKKIFIPQFHGRQHLNIKRMMDGLKKGNQQMLHCVKNKSWTAIENVPNYLSAYSFQTPEENNEHIVDLNDGIMLFNKIFGFMPEHFVPPQGKYNRILEVPLKNMGINYIDVPRVKLEPQLDGSLKKVYTYLGKKNKYKQKYIVRNCMFENAYAGGIDWVDYCLYSIDAAFKMHSPAIISSHRVNFVGHIEKSYRDKGLRDLEKLLKTIVKKWPQVEFMSLSELGTLMK